jgi:hypothetical protein
LATRNTDRSERYFTYRKEPRRREGVSWMGRIADLDAELHELPDYEKGIQAERERIVKILNETVDVYLLDKLLVEASVIVNAIEFIKKESKG